MVVAPRLLRCSVATLRSLGIHQFFQYRKKLVDGRGLEPVSSAPAFAPHRGSAPMTLHFVRPSTSSGLASLAVTPTAWGKIFPTPL